MDKHDPKHDPVYDDSLYDKIFGIIDHPENYTSEQLAEILSSPEAKEIYNLLCLTASAEERRRPVDTDAAWRDFSYMHISRRRQFFGIKGRRVASAAVIVASSIAAVAAGIAVSVAISVRRSADAPSRMTETVITESDQHSGTSLPDTSAMQEVAVTAERSAPTVFEDETLETIINQISVTYDVKVRFNNKATATLHLYYKFDPALTIGEIVSQLNTFEQINIRLEDNTLIID